jgi:hypothetical protein
MLTLVAYPTAATAHCDTMSGPVVTSARLALDKGDITPVLKWIAEPSEREAREAFDLTRRVRVQGESARELADRFFFETVVRLHRLSEGEPYTGLKPADYPVEPIILAADRALENGSVDTLLNQLSGEMQQVVRQRFTQTAVAKGRAEDSVKEGRAFAHAYTSFMGLLEQLTAAMSGADEAQSMDTGRERR